MKIRLFLIIIICLLSHYLFAQVHTTYLWHLQQPNYWPEQSQWDQYHYQTVYESDWLKNNNGNWYSDGQQHPLNDLEEIFNKDDRKAVYQWRTKDAVQSLLGHPEAGAQVNYSGCLIENINSLANAGQWGYSNGWNNNFITARNWQTSGGNPRMDVVGFTMHHALSPLLSDKVLKKQIQAHKHIYTQTFGSNPYYSKGYWPAECSFSERIIKVLSEEGFEWSVIANSHLARTLSDYPLNFGTSGCNIDPPNYADVTNFAGNNWWNGQIDGRGGAFAAPFCYQAHKAKYVDPETEEEYIITVVPMSDLLSYMNGYSLMGTGEIDSHIAPFDDPSQPSIVLMAHDGDNAWGGGYDYYNNSVPGFANQAASQGYVPSTIQQFLDDHPVTENDIVHVEDGSWFNAANDWGHPQFINWIWPMYTQDYEFDENGWTEDVRNWAVLVAAENRVVTAEDLAGGVDIQDIVYPNSSSNLAERAWHHLLPGYTSGYMYYGTSLDMEVKQSLACNLACNFADQMINSNPGVDNTTPTVFIPQRYPYNPGGIGFGPTYAYQQHQNSSDFHVWTFAYDVSGLQSVNLKYRLDNDGINPLTDNDNDTYTGGAGVQNWNSISMTERIFPIDNVTGNPDINFFILPDYIANEYYAEITGLSDTLIDYYIEAIDNHGNVFKTPIQHVYVGEYNPGGPGGDYDISWEPENPDENDIITITITNPPTTGKLHWGVNNQGSSWQTPDEVYWPEGTYLFNGTGSAVETPLNENGNDELTLQFGPFNDPAQEVFSIAFVIHYDDNSWDNNSGNDYHISIQGQGITGVYWEPENPDQNDTIKIFVGEAVVGANLHWGVSVDGNSWQTPVLSYWPEGSFLFNGTGPAIESEFDGPDVNNVLSITLDPFNDPEQVVDGIDFVIHYNNGTWDNNNGMDYFIPILVSSSEIQEYSLTYGYQFISSYLNPENPDMQIICNDILDNLDFVRNTSGNMLRKIGPNWINGIGDWITTEGYLFRMNNEDEFSISGDLIDPQTPISLIEGYQFVSFLPTDPMDAEIAFNDILDNLDFVRNSTGNMLRKIGPNWVNGIGDLFPGEAYLVRMNQSDVLIYPVSKKKSGNQLDIQSEYFTFKGGNAADPVFTIYVSGLEIGDEVAAYGENEIFGAIKINSNYFLDNELPVFSTLSEEIGYEQGAPIILKVWSHFSNNVENVEFTIENIYDGYTENIYPAEDGKYCVVNIKKSTDNEENSIVIFPNPAENLINISSPNPINNITIFNYVGQTIYHGNSTRINTSNFKTGVYIIRVETSKGIEIQMFTVK